MRFWDTSAVVPLIVEEPASPACRRELRADSSMAVWALTRTEIVSALRRRERAGDMAAEEIVTALGRLTARAGRWIEVSAMDEVRRRAERLLAVHALRAADALQLGAALALFDDQPGGRLFLTRDTGLADAARREGFGVLIPR